MKQPAERVEDAPCPCCWPSLAPKYGPGLSRRTVIGAALACTLARPAASLPDGPARQLAALGGERRLSLSHASGDGRWEGVYWRDGAYDPAALAALSVLLRDRTADTAGEIDPSLFDILALLDRRVAGRGFVVVSAYRTPATQAALAARWGRAAANSQHVEGRAVDVRRPGLHALGLVGAAVQLRAGGVGLYRGASPYVHLDTGPVRRW